MKTRFQVLAAAVAFTFASFSSHAAVLSDPFTTNSTNSTSVLNVVAPAEGTGNMLTNATILNDGTVISNTPSNVGITDNIDNALSYHHGSSGGNEGISGKNMVYAGVGFVSLLGLLTSAYTTAGYTSTHIPVITVAYERGLSEHWGIGFLFYYNSSTLNLNGSMDNTYGYYPYNSGQVYSYTDKATISGMAFAVTGMYHFTASEKVDPYMGMNIGYEIISFSWSTNDPNQAYDGNIPAASISGGLPMFNIYGGLRVYFTNNIGAWFDVGWHGFMGALLNVGLVAKF